MYFKIFYSCIYTYNIHTHTYKIYTYFMYINAWNIYNIYKYVNVQTYVFFYIHEHMFEFYVYIFNISDVKFGNYQIIEACVVLEKWSKMRKTLVLYNFHGASLQ